jgi:hypothetical protein
VATRPEGAVDRRLPGLRGKQLDQLGGEDGLVLYGHDSNNGIAPASNNRIARYSLAETRIRRSLNAGSHFT